MAAVRATALVTAVLGGLLVAGCSTVTQGTALPAGPTPSAPSSAAPTSSDYGAPKVATPLDTTRFQQNPCSALTRAQQQALGISAAGSVEVDDLGNICHWSLQYDVVYAFGFNVKFPEGEALGLANAYQNAGPGAMRRLPDVYGQPAAIDPSQNTDGLCAVYLGATDQISYAATVQIGPDQPDYQNPCSVAEQIAADTTATMKSGKSSS